ncbi:berberine bridge enzyme-like D-2 isoform X2 [Nicotiana sylvestris]|uniref:Reticuline oxidase-like isoform X2 n=1 Tax=Nicotiana sylvestris TaxID=4096 RepID=A0A1U7WYM1_NICSY|nr:PREDICTED: reticuline oxidase-like isoform X2 [Nicotiana sylvestris]
MKRNISMSLQRLLIILMMISFLFTSLLVPSVSATNLNTISTCLINYKNLRFAASSKPKPTVIIVPESKEQLVSSVLCCRQGSYEIRVRCGGHSYEGTSYVSFDGSPFVVIDLMKLDDVSVDLDSETAWVQGGATLGQTYYAISRASDVHGFSAGSCPTVGVGGHISGGGFGFLSRKYGLAADNVVDALLVDAEGRLLDRKAMGEEVFWAIRGGGGGIWGIIYAWKIRLLKVPKTVTSFIVPSPGSKRYVSQLVHKWQLVAPKLDDDFYLSISMSSASKGNIPIEINAQFSGFYLGTKTEAISILNEAFPELGVVESDCKEMSWIESTLFFSELDNVANTSDVSRLKERYFENKSYFKAKSDHVKTPISVGGIMTALDVLEKEPNGYVIFDPYGAAMQRISEEAIAFPHRKGNLFRIQYLVVWKEKDNNNIAKSNGYIEWIREFYNTMAPHVSSSPRAAYVNYMDLDLGVMDDYLMLNTSITASADHAVERARVWGEKYFLNNYDRLVKAKTKIDPLNVFRHQQGIPPMFASMPEHTYSSK